MKQENKAEVLHTHLDVRRHPCENIRDHSYVVHEIISGSSLAEYDVPIDDPCEFDWVVPFEREEGSGEMVLEYHVILTVGDTRWYGIQRRPENETRTNKYTT